MLATTSDELSGLACKHASHDQFYASSLHGNWSIDRQIQAGLVRQLRFSEMALLEEVWRWQVAILLLLGL